MKQKPNAPHPDDVHFVQYLRPDGQPRDIWIRRPDPIPALATRLWDAGCELAIEQLQTLELSMTIEREHDGETQVLATQLCSNGPIVEPTVDTLINTAIAKLEAS